MVRILNSNERYCFYVTAGCLYFNLQIASISLTLVKKVRTDGRMDGSPGYAPWTLYTIGSSEARPPFTAHSVRHVGHSSRFRPFCAASVLLARAQ